MIIKYNGHKIELYDSIHDLPITRFQVYQINVLLASGIGSDIGSIDKHINVIKRLIKDDPEAAKKGLVNIQQNMRFILSKTSPEANSFVALVKKIDGRDISDDYMTDDGIQGIIKELGNNRFSYAAMLEALKGIKKKINIEFDYVFPELSNGSETRSFYTKLKKRTTLVLKGIIEEIDNSDQIKKIDDFLLAMFKPKTYHGRDGVKVKMVMGFEETCIILRQHNVSNDPKKMTTLAFYQALRHVKKTINKK